MFCKHDVHGGLYKSYYKANYTRGEFCVQWSVGPLRRINTCRRKGKGSRCCLVDRNYSFLAALVVLHKDDLKNRMNFTRKIERKGWIHNILQNRPSTGWQIVMCVCVCCVCCVFALVFPIWFILQSLFHTGRPCPRQNGGIFSVFVFNTKWSVLSVSLSLSSSRSGAAAKRGFNLHSRIPR